MNLTKLQFSELMYKHTFKENSFQDFLKLIIESMLQSKTSF